MRLSIRVRENSVNTGWRPAGGCLGRKPCSPEGRTPSALVRLRPRVRSGYGATGIRRWWTSSQGVAGTPSLRAVRTSVGGIGRSSRARHGPPCRRGSLHGGDVGRRHGRDRMTTSIHDDARRWETLLAETREARIGKPIGGASTFQDLVAHLTAWRTDAVDRLEATVAGTREPRASSNTSRTSGHGSIGGTAWEGEGQCAETVGCDMATLDPRARSQPAGGSGSRSRGLRMAPDYLITCRSRQRDSGPARSDDVPSSASSSIDR